MEGGPTFPKQCNVETKGLIREEGICCPLGTHSLIKEAKKK